MKQIDFLLCGTQKSGTTALFAFLSRHPQIGVPKGGLKELHYFDDDSRDWQTPDPAALHAHFDWDDPAILTRGEATPVYTYWPRCLDRIRAYNPGMKMILGLRHPAFRAFSAWQMETKRNTETLDFDTAVSARGRARVGGAPDGVHRVHSYVERGFYAPQVAALLERFPRDQLAFYTTDQLWSDHAGTVARIETFLGVTPGLRRADPAAEEDAETGEAARFIVPLKGERQSLAARARVTLGRWRRGQFTTAPPPRTIPPESRARLQALFAEDITRTAELTGLDLSAWLDAGYAEPMPAGR